MRKFTTAVIAVFLATATCVWAVGQEPIAVVTNLRGAVRLTQAGTGKPEALETTTVLRAGDRLQAGENGHAVLFQLHAPSAVLGSDQTADIQPRRASTNEGVLTAELLGLIEKHLRAATESLDQKRTLHGGGEQQPAVPERVRDRLALTAIAPRRSLVLDPRPTFEWTSVRDANRYEITVYRPDEEETEVWKILTRETQVTYPTDAVRLQPGEYKWGVVAHVPDRRLIDTAQFTIAMAQEIVDIPRVLARIAGLVTDREITNLPYVAVCLENRLYPQAEAALKEATARAPADHVVRALLTRLCQLTHRSGEDDPSRPIPIDAK